MKTGLALLEENYNTTLSYRVQENMDITKTGKGKIMKQIAGMSNSKTKKIRYFPHIYFQVIVKTSQKQKLNLTRPKIQMQTLDVVL